ncbi:hypothetical protein [Actinoallomurus rhizosphaericola]|uniref:hypothetical protein n=1 Tax=Actinoallomurus rhizosphaericola TaxID=2952536 RepID=UPI0020920DB2|nr:hypothetical protein [Actinoallomurus rhizosphaericola]MCO5998315.1 hypothetical protein [Actinoallomurus rhizosphaericola]
MAETRDVFIVCNNVEELGGLQRWAHDIGRMFAARGHRVHLVGITHAEHPHDYGRDLPYTVTVLHERALPPARGPVGARLRRVRHQLRVRRRRRTPQRAVPHREPGRRRHRGAGLGHGVGGARRHRGHAGDRHEP